MKLHTRPERSSLVLAASLLAGVSAALVAGCTASTAGEEPSQEGFASSPLIAFGKRYKVGDWDGDGRDNLAVRRGNQVLMDDNFDGVHDRVQAYGNGNSEDL